VSKPSAELGYVHQRTDRAISVDYPRPTPGRLLLDTCRHYDCTRSFAQAFPLTNKKMQIDRKLFTSHLKGWLGVSAFALAAVCFAQDALAENLSIEGTYMLVGRKLPDGTMVKPPDVMGMITMQGGYKHVNVFWKGSSGEPFSWSMVSRYRLTPTEFSETLLYITFDNPAEAKSPIVNLSGETKSVAVQTSAERVSFQLPFEPMVVFEREKLTATIDGQFIDYWDKVR